MYAGEAISLVPKTEGVLRHNNAIVTELELTASPIVRVHSVSRDNEAARLRPIKGTFTKSQKKFFLSNLKLLQKRSPIIIETDGGRLEITHVSELSKLILEIFEESRELEETP